VIADRQTRFANGQLFTSTRSTPSASISRSHPANRSPCRGTSILDVPDITQADGETRTPDPFITSEVLYQLSYVGARRMLARAARPRTTLAGSRALVPLGETSAAPGMF
jgi:hypothetical protein